MEMHYDAINAIAEANRIKGIIQERFRISEEDANEILNKATDYNVDNEEELLAVAKIEFEKRGE